MLQATAHHAQKINDIIIKIILANIYVLDVFIINYNFIRNLS